ncbi:PIN domain-containing protein [Rickettsia hoogstraalii]|uniref:PIN domain-containing protein n=2 Tax=Rickettsia hoogstraalii TaxID=467174 RepID=UPI00396A11AA
MESFLKNFLIINLNEEIAEIAVVLRKENKIKLPDAIIWATAKFTNSILITRNTKDFPVNAFDIKVPYSI